LEFIQNLAELGSGKMAREFDNVELIAKSF
jgi:hypothetical protein